MKLARFLSIAAAVTLGGLVCYFIIHLFSLLLPFSIIDGDSPELEYSDFVSIMLTAVSIILAVLGFVIAILAFVGWNTIGDRVSSLSEKLFHDSIKEDGNLRRIIHDSLQEGGELFNLVKAEAARIIYEGVQPINREDEGDKDTDENNDS